MLPTPGNVTPLPVESNPAEAALPGTVVHEDAPPPLPGAGTPPPPAAVNPAYHQPDPNVTELNPPPLADSADVVIVDPVDAAPPPMPTGAEAPPIPGTATLVPPTAVAEAPPIPGTATLVPPTAVAEAPPIPGTVAAPPPATMAPPPVAAPPAAVEPAAPVAVAPIPAAPMAPAASPQQSLIAQAGGIENALAASGFAGLKMGFGSFPIVKLVDQNFTTSDGDSLGQTFVCIMHSSRAKYLYKCSEESTAEELVYSYDKIHTTSGDKLIADVTAEWAAKGWMKPVWKEYVDVTAQIVDLGKKELGNVVILSVPWTSNARLTGYTTTILLRGLEPNQIITQVYPGQRVTSGKKPFHPWAFKEYDRVSNLLGH